MSERPSPPLPPVRLASLAYDAVPDVVTRHKRAAHVRCLFVGHDRAPLSLPGGSRIVFAGVCRRCSR